MGSWSQVVLAGKKADVFDPAGKPRFGVLFLHGVGLETLVEQPVFTGLLADAKLACVCPHGQRSWWGDRLCAEFDGQLTPERHLLHHVMPFIEQRWGLASPAIGLLGISMGGQGALRLAFRHARSFPVVAAISPALDYHEVFGQGTPLDEMYDSKEQCRQDTALLHISPLAYPPHILFCIDPEDELWYRGNDRLHEKLAALGIPHTHDLTTTAGGHSWTYFNHMAGAAMRFLRDGLAQESRRLL